VRHWPSSANAFDLTDSVPRLRRRMCGSGGPLPLSVPFRKLVLFCLCPNGAAPVKPRVAALWRLPWERNWIHYQPQRGCVCLGDPESKCRNRVAVGLLSHHVSQGSRQKRRQPWALPDVAPLGHQEETDQTRIETLRPLDHR
jgi:hypothetical protein